MEGDFNKSTTESSVSTAPWLKKKCRYLSVPEFDMAITKWFGQLQPVQLYIILALTIAFFIIELIFSHVTHALTLLMESYHMLCNIMALVGCIITMKYGTLSDSQSNLRKSASQSKGSSVGEELTSNPTPCSDKKRAKTSLTQETQLRKLKNTFGWARIDVISMLMCCVFLASFSFSIFVEALQTLVHIDHQDEMHYPISVFCIGTVGLLLNGVCYLVIGGYTFHQGSFLYITESGDVVLSKVVVNQSVQHGERRLSRTKYIRTATKVQKQRQGLWEMMRDVNGCIIVIICAALIYFTNKNTAKYIDPLLSLVSATLIMVLSYPYVKESCLILLQTIPDTINIDVLKAELLNHFPDIVNVHDFHIWQLTGSKIYSTVHIIFESPKVYGKIKEDVKDFFNENGISHVTIQPEFYNKDISMESLMNKVSADCLVSCQEEGCKKSHCCPEYKTESIFGSKDGLIANPKSKNSEVIQFNDFVNDPNNLDEKIKNEINLAKSELIEPAKQEVPSNSSINVEGVNEKLNEENVTETNAESQLVVSEDLCTEKEEVRDVNVKSVKQTTTDIFNQEREMLSHIQETVTKSIDEGENISQKNSVRNDTDLQVDNTV